jgi:DEAD/DEAH box helicase domain-containing protein
VGYGDVHLPEMQVHTNACWLCVPEDIVRAQPVARPVVIDALWGLAHSLHLCAAVGLMVDPRDLGVTIGDRTEDDAPPSKDGRNVGFDPTIFLYDRVAGGIGLSLRLFEAGGDLLHRARTLIEGCACEAGCPTCVGPVVGAPDGAEVGTRREIALSVLTALGITRAQ